MYAHARIIDYTCSNRPRIRRFVKCSHTVVAVLINAAANPLASTLSFLLPFSLHPSISSSPSLFSTTIFFPPSLPSFLPSPFFLFFFLSFLLFLFFFPFFFFFLISLANSSRITRQRTGEDPSSGIIKARKNCEQMRKICGGTRDMREEDENGIRANWRNYNRAMPLSRCDNKIANWAN